MKPRIAGPAATLALLVGATACAGVQQATAVQDRNAVLLSDRPAPRPECRILQRPTRLPAVEEIADSAALHRTIAQYARTNRLGPDSRILLSLGWGMNGQVERTKDIDWLLPANTAPALALLVRGHLKPQATKTDLRLLVAGGDTPTFRVGRSEECPPELRVRIRLIQPAWYRGSPPLPARARVLVGTNGAVRGVTLERSSGETELDRFITEMITRATFAPGLIDGEPQVMETQLTVPFESR